VANGPRRRRPISPAARRPDPAGAAASTSSRLMTHFLGGVGRGRGAAGEGRRLDLATLDPVATRHNPPTTRTNDAGASPALLASEPWDLLGSRLRPGLHVDAPTTNERQTNAMKPRNYKPLCNENKVSYVTMSRAIFYVCHVGNPETRPETARRLADRPST